METPAKKSDKKAVLGRGLSAILGSAAEQGTRAVLPEATLGQEIPVDGIEVNPYQPRTYFDPEALQELMDSIAEHGLVQPITVRRLSEGRYQLISGERRLQATRRLGLSRIPAYIRTANDEQMLELALIENIQRQELNPIEISLGYQRLMEECALTFEEVGQKVGKKRSTVNNYLRLLKLPPALQSALREGSLGMGHARALITVDNPLIQLDMYEQIVREGLSVRQVEAMVTSLGKAPTPSPKPARSSSPDARALALRDLERRMEKKLGARVALSQKEDGSGELRIRFYSDDELSRLVDTLEA